MLNFVRYKTTKKPVDIKKPLSYRKPKRFFKFTHPFDGISFKTTCGLSTRQIYEELFKRLHQTVK